LKYLLSNLKPKYTHISPLLLLFDLLFLKIFASARISYNVPSIKEVLSDSEGFGCVP